MTRIFNETESVHFGGVDFVCDYSWEWLDEVIHIIQVDGIMVSPSTPQLDLTRVFQCNNLMETFIELCHKRECCKQGRNY